VIPAHQRSERQLLARSQPIEQRVLVDHDVV
jgi:hypothetical protein